MLTLVQLYRRNLRFFLSWGPSVKFLSILLPAVALIAQPAFAETHIFLVDNSDGYGINRCLASGDACGKVAAAAICHNRKYAEAIDFGRADTSKATGSTPQAKLVSLCEGSSCADMVAITCSR